MLLRIEQQTEYIYPTSTKKQLEFSSVVQPLSFLRCASCLFVNHFLVLLYFLFLLAVCTVQPHFSAPLQPAAPGAEPESPSGCYASAPDMESVVVKSVVFELNWCSSNSEG